ncbi:MAG: transglycosylase SLT domain-containing protein [bacterium]
MFFFSANNNIIPSNVPFALLFSCCVLWTASSLTGCSSNPHKKISYEEDEDSIEWADEEPSKPKAHKSKTQKAQVAQQKTSRTPSHAHPHSQATHTKPLPKTPSRSQQNYHPPASHSPRLITTHYQPRRDHVRQTRHDLWQNVYRGFRLGNHNRHPHVAKIIREYRSRNQPLQASLNRSQPYLHMIVEEVKRRNMPMEALLVAFVESGFQPTAVSRSGASGLWQFMPTTGKRYGLPRNREFDARLDPFAATGAAMNYLQMLHRQFKGDWLLAFAAYNAGEGRVIQAIAKAKRAGRPINFWHLDLPAETRRYVPKILAYKEVLLNPQHFRVRLPNIANTPYLTQIRIEKPLNLRLVATRAGLPANTLTQLNPYFLKGVANPRLSKRVIIPRQHAKRITQVMRHSAVRVAVHSAPSLQPSGATQPMFRVVNYPLSLATSQHALLKPPTQRTIHHDLMRRMNHLFIIG